MLATIRAAALYGVDACPVQVEVDVSFGMPMFTMVGLPDASVRESRDRVRAAGGSARTPIEYPSGWSVDCVDDQGTEFSLSVPSPEYGSVET